MTSLAVTILGILLAAIGFELGDSWPYHAGTMLGYVGTAMSMLGAFMQYQESKPHEHPFSESSWQPTGDGFAVHIPSLHHRCRAAATVTVLQRSGTGYEEVMCGVKSTASGGVVVEANVPFSGKVVVR